LTSWFFGVFGAARASAPMVARPPSPLQVRKPYFLDKQLLMSTVQWPRKSKQAAAHRAGSIELSGDVEFTSEIIREKVDAKVRENEKEEADKIAIITNIIIIIIMLLYHHHHASLARFVRTTSRD
jgi:hypothetical protein